MPYKDRETRLRYARNRRIKELANPDRRQKHIESSQAWYRNNKEQHNAGQRERNRLIKIEAIQKYGGKCYCCEESIILFLALDHKEGNGNQHRKETGTQGGVQFYRWLKRRGWPDGYQVACHNCNMGRHMNGGICPHKNGEQLASENNGTEKVNL